VGTKKRSTGSFELIALEQVKHRESVSALAEDLAFTAQCWHEDVRLDSAITNMI
jgi:hypothetical protein